MGPDFSTATPPPLPAELTGLLPAQGSFELQHDQPGKTHNWHHHSLDEELFVINGDVTLFWTGADGYQERHCPPGTWIRLPAGVVHGSTAGPAGTVYMIRPEGGATARTTFLEPEEYPHQR